ncbi:MAG: hypothetical protein J5700_04815, partial [Treponema sp.]|nr:hypothetical protein [Treponema sp.]
LIAAKCDKGLLYINAGLWYAFAPAIGGGSDSKAKDYFSFAAQNGPSDYEKFFGWAYLSQMEFKRGNLDACLKLLDRADAISPSNIYTDFVRRVNKAGCDIFEYADDKDKVMSKVNKYYGKK